MAAYDAFSEIAPYYDAIMDHVNYDRWFLVTTALGALLPRNFTHLDAACGTGTLIKRLRVAGWNSVGIDLSSAMVKAGRKGAATTPPAAVADLRALPLHCGVDYVTCLFDSINFLMDIDAVERAFREVFTALRAPGIFYFDVITERMVMQYFDGQEWTEQNGRFSTTWRSNYSRKTTIAETHVRVNSGPAGTVLERVYTQDEIERVLSEAGFSLLGAFDAHAWKPPGRRTARIDFVAAKDDSPQLRKRFDAVYGDLRDQLA